MCNASIAGKLHFFFKVYQQTLKKKCSLPAIDALHTSYYFLDVRSWKSEVASIIFSCFLEKSNKTINLIVFLKYYGSRLEIFKITSGVFYILLCSDLSVRKLEFLQVTPSLSIRWTVSSYCCFASPPSSPLKNPDILWVLTWFCTKHVQSV